MVLLLHVATLYKKGRRSQYFNKMGLLRKLLLVNLWRKSRIGRSSRNDVTLFWAQRLVKDLVNLK